VLTGNRGLDVAQSADPGTLETRWRRRWALQCGALFAATALAALVLMVVPEGESWLAALPRRLASAALLVLAWPVCVGLLLAVFCGPPSPFLLAIVFLLLALAQWGMIWGIGAGVRRLKLDLWYGPVLVVWVTVGILLSTVWGLMAGR